MQLVKGKPILLVEDNKIDIVNLKRAFARCAIQNPLHVARNGEEALQLLRGPGLRLAPLPGLIFLDLNMPLMNGLEFLAQMREDSVLCHLPTVVLTTSAEEGDRRSAFALGIAGYFIKPMSSTDFVEMIRHIATYWSLSEQP